MARSRALEAARSRLRPAAAASGSAPRSTADLTLSRRSFVMPGIEALRRGSRLLCSWRASCRVAAAACAFAAGCASQDGAEFRSSPVSLPLEESVAASPSVSIPTAAGEFVGDQSDSAVVSLWHASVRTSVDAVPFSAADLFASAATRRLRMPLDSRDVEGPFRGRNPEHVLLLHESGVFDLCDDAEAFEAITGQSYRAGDLFPQDTYAQLIFDRYRMGCDGAVADPDRREPRWALRANDRGDTIRFASYDEAVAYQQEQIASYRDQFANTVDTPAFGLHGAVPVNVLIHFAGADAPVDEVRLLGDSVTVVDGVLRGMVRNWSRELWAYNVTVTADGRTFEWPLSVQPGELAPFEIVAWKGSLDARGIDIDVTAQMVREADLSRAFVFFFGREWRGNAYDVPYDYPKHIREDLPQAGSHDLYLSYWQFHEPASHSWTADPHALAGWQTGDFYESLISQLRFDGLRAYLALITYADASSGAGADELAVFELQPLDIVAPLNEEHDGAGSAVVDRWPISRIELDWRKAIDPKLHMVFHVPNTRDNPEFIAGLGVGEEDLASAHLSWVIWIGAAHESDERE